MQKMNDIVQENAQMKQFQPLGSKMVTSSPQETSSSPQENSELSEQMHYCQNEINGLKQRLEILENTSNVHMGMSVKPSSHFADTENRLNQSVTQLSERLNQS